MIQNKNADFQIPDQQKILDILKVRFPQSSNLAKAQVVLNLMQWTTSSVDKKESALANLRTSIATAQDLNPNDEEIQEILWITMIQQNQRRLLTQSLNQYMAKHPDSKIGRYYLAGDAWNMKDREQCRSILQKLAKQFPDDKRISSTLAALDSARYGDKIFSVSTNISFQ